MSSPGEAGPWASTLAATVAVSLGLHAAGLALAARLEPRRPPPPAPVEVDFEAVAPPPAEPRKPEPPLPAAPRRVALARLPPPPPEARPTPPPPPSEAPPEARPAARAVPLTGLSLSSTVESGGFAVPAGNTLYGTAPQVAPDPKEVEPHPAQGTAPPPPTRLSAQPRLLETPEFAYPPDAERAGVEGQVRLLLRIDRTGRVVGARVLSEPGAGLGEAARAGALRLRFSPGLLDGEPVEVPDLILTYTFHLD